MERHKIFLFASIVLLVSSLHPLCAGQDPESPPTPPQPFFAWTELQFPKEEHAARRARLVEQLGDTGGGIYLTPSFEGFSSGETFRQLDDFIYFTGLELPNSVLAIDSKSGTTTLFVPPRDRRFFNPSRRNDFPGRDLASDPQISSRSGIGDVRALSKLQESLDAWQRNGRLIRIALRRGHRLAQPVQPWSPARTLVLHLREGFPGLRIQNAQNEVARLRMVKSPREIEVIERACAITADGIIEAASTIKDGVDERTLEGELEQRFKAGGAQRRAFDSIIKSGPNSLWPWRILAAHYDRRNRAMKDGELVIFDVGCELDHYASDVGRTFPVSGRFTPRQRDLVRMVTSVSDAVIAAVRPGVKLSDLQRLAVGRIPEKERRYMQAGVFFGHHIGLDVGDANVPNLPLEAGMTFTVEPWYYNHHEKVAVFIEDVVVVTATGARNLTATLPRSPRGLEAVVGRRTGTLRLLAYNVRHGAGMDLKVDLERTARVINAVKPDVVTLQEIDDRTGRTGGVDQARRLGALTGMHAVFGSFMDYDGGRYGMALLSRHPIEDVQNHRLPEGAEPRTALAARIRLRGTDRRLIVAGIHLYRTEEERLAQAEKLLEIFRDDTLPVILAGDFNSRPGSKVLRLLQERWQIVEKKGESPFTFPADTPDREIDFVMISKGSPLRLLSHGVIPEAVASDHRPILIVLEWR